MGDYTLFSCSDLGYGKRMAFANGAVNPRNQIGKIGIATHSKSAAFFHDCFQIQAVEKESGEEKTFYLNLGSLVEWLNSQLDDAHKVSKASSTKTFLKRIEQVTGENFNASAAGQKLNHVGTREGRSLHSRVNSVVSYLLELFWKLTLKSYTLFRFRFVFLSCEDSILSGARYRAAAAYNHAYKYVPGYKQFVDDQPQPSEGIRKFSQAPTTNKKNYILKYGNPEEGKLGKIFVNGVVPDEGTSDSSTGTTGEPTQWFRQDEERKTVRTLLNFATNVVMQDKPVVFINAFALGQWATGMTTTMAMANRAMVYSTGPNMDNIFRNLRTAHLNMPGRQIVLAGYPPFMGDLVVEAEKRGIDLKQYNIIGVVGGQGMSETLRQKIIDGGFKDCISTYGASDLDINLGYESPFEIKLRKLLQERPEIAAELYGKDKFIPSIFHYDPFNYYIETVKDKDGIDTLIFTCCRLDRASPRVRYDLGDEGKVMAASDIVAILRKHGITDLVPNTYLPLMFIWGRKGSQVSYRGAKVSHEHLEDAVKQIEYLDRHVKNFAFYKTDPNADDVEIWLELKEGVDPGEFAKTYSPDEMRDALADILAKSSDDFRWQVDEARKIGVDKLPQVRLIPYGVGPMAKADAHRKKEYIFYGPFEKFFPTEEKS